MNKLGIGILIAVIPLLLTNCGAEEEEPKGVIPQGYKDALNKAENVEGFLQDTKKKRDEEMEKAIP